MPGSIRFLKVIPSLRLPRQFNIKPETLLWANYDLLNDNPDMISIGMELKIPPVDGVYYQWQDGDTLDKRSGAFRGQD